jgi:glycosyltransferase involved in cell wall biosynthesis
MLTPSDNSNGSDKDRLHVLEIMANAITGGMENYVRRLIRLLPDDQFQVTCLCPYESAVTAQLRSLGCEVHVTRMDDDPPWRSIQTTVEIIRAGHVDLIHANMPKAHVLAGLAGALTRTPAVATVHGMTITTHELGITRTTGTNLITVCQEAYMQALAMGVPEERVTLIHNGVDLRVFRPGVSPAAFQQTLDLPEGAPVVGFVGRLEWEKGPDQFVLMAEFVHREWPTAHFVMVGTGSMRDDLAARIKDMGAESYIHLAGFWPEPAEVYPVFDVVAQVSRIEGTPLTLLEAMASGRPVAAIAVGGVLEVVENGTTGLITGPGDWQGVGERVIDLLNHPEQRKQMGEAARKRAEKMFNLRETVRQTAELFERLARARAGSRSRWHSTWPSLTVAR